MSITSEATNSDVMKEKPQKRVTIMDPKSPSSRELYAKLASANGYSIEPEIDLAAFNSAEFTNTFTLLSNSSPSLNQSFPSSPLLKESMFCDKGVKERLVFGIPLLQWLKLSDAEREAHKRNMRKVSCFRTRLCRAFQKGFCPYGQLCNFAHGEVELHNPPPLHPKYKTMLCRNFVHGICPYGDRCQFIHNKTGVSMDSGFAYSQNFSQSLASASNPVHHRAPFAASSRYSFNHSMMAGSTTSYNMPSMDHKNNYRSTMETFRMGLQESGSPIDTTPKRGHSSLNSSCNFNRSTRNLHYKPLIKSDEADNLFGLMQKLTLAEDEELENHQDFMNSIGGHHLDT